GGLTAGFYLGMRFGDGAVGARVVLEGCSRENGGLGGAGGGGLAGGAVFGCASGGCGRGDAARGALASSDGPPERNALGVFYLVGSGGGDADMGRPGALRSGP